MASVTVSIAEDGLVVGYVLTAIFTVCRTSISHVYLADYITGRCLGHPNMP